MTHPERNQSAVQHPAGSTDATPQQQRGPDTGGIPHTADSAIRESKQAPDKVPGIEPARKAGDTAGDETRGKAGDHGSDERSGDSSQGLAGTHGGPTAVPEQLGADSSDDPPGQEDESPAESLGRAIGAPLSGEAAKKEPRR